MHYNAERCNDKKIGLIKPDVAKKVESATGINVDGWTHGIDEAAIRHIFEQHGDAESEAKRGQVAVTHEDIANIHQVVENPDEVTNGEPLPDGTKTVIYKKTTGDTSTYVQEVRTGRKKLTAKTLWKTRAVPPVTPESNTVHTSETSNAHRSPQDDASVKQSTATSQDSVNDSYDDSIPFSIPQSKTTNAHTQASLSTALRTALDKVFGNGWFNRLLATSKFKVIDRTQAAAFGANPNAQAFYNPKDDTTYFVADNIDKGTNLVKLALHEIGVHALQMGKDSAEFKAILQQVKNLTEQRNPSKAVKAAIKAAQDANTPPHLFLEEVAGYLVENHPDLNVSQKIITWFKAMLRKLGVRIAMNDADIVTMATAALRTAPDSLLFDEPTRKEGIRNSEKANKPLLAPNGKPSKLNAMQYAQLRTPEFMAWFGDWVSLRAKEFLNGKPEIILTGDEFKKSEEKLTDKVSRWFAEKHNSIARNEIIGDVIIDERGVKDSIAHGIGKNKSAAFAAVPEIIAKGRILDSHVNWKSRGYDSYTIGAPVKIADKDFVAVVIVHKDDKTNRFYLQEVVLREKLQYQAIQDRSIDQHDVALNGNSHTGAIASLLQKIYAVNDSDVSKVVDENGEPLVVYHGSPSSSITVFDKSKEGLNTGQADENHGLGGFYFTNKPDYADVYTNSERISSAIMEEEDFGERLNKKPLPESTIYPTFLNIKKPLTTNGAITKSNVDAAKANNDGIISETNQHWNEYVAFEPNQIKSAIGNTGAFSTDNNDIRYSIASTATDYFTEQPRRARTLADRYAMLDTGKQPNDKIGWQHYFDKVVTTFTDSTRPFARFVQDTFDAEHASALLSGADRALGMKAAYEKEAMGLFGNRVADGIRAIEKVLAEKYPTISRSERYKTAKDIAGDWMTVSYAPDANDWLMQKDQDAIDALESEILKATDPEVLKALDKKLIKAQDAQQARIDAINDPAIIDPTQQKQEAGLAGGFNNATAADYKARIEAKIPLALLEATAKPIYEMNAWKLKRDIADGKISQATADKFPKYAHYVPLTGDPRTDDSVDDHFSTGSVNQAKDKALGGRTGSIAQNGIDASFEQLEKSARYHGWNDFKTALTKTYDDLIAEKMATGLTQKQAEQAVWDENHLKRRAETGMIPAGENDITVRKDGKGFIYTVNNQAAMEALRSVNEEPTPSILKPIAALTRLQARMVTQFMPLFAPTNMLHEKAF